MDTVALTEHTVAEAVRKAGIESPSFFFEITGSTNTDAFRMGGDGAPGWTVVVADRQTAGRGRLGRTWTTPAASSLLVSVLLRPDISASDAPVLSLSAAVAMAEACEGACGVQVRCKWPNDLVVGSRKVGGILPEASFTDGRLDYVVVGAGVNMLQSTEDFEPALRDSATSVKLEGGRADLSGLLTRYLSGLRVRSRDPGNLTEYRARCATLGKQVGATTSAGVRIRGRAIDVGASGELIVDTAEGRSAVAFGEIVHLD